MKRKTHTSRNTLNTAPPRSLFVFNEYVGLTVLGAVDVGGAIFVHAFGAVFGLAAAAVAGRGRDVSLSSHLEASTYRDGWMVQLSCTLKQIPA